VSTLDAILAAVNRLVDRPVLFVVKLPINYQPGCGPGRPVYAHRFLLVHPKDEAEEANGRLPASVRVAPDDVRVDDAGAEIDGVQIMRCAAVFNPRLGDRYDRADWLPSDFVVDHPWAHPIAARAVESFERAETIAVGERRGANGLELGRGIYFDQQPSGEISMEPRSVFIEIQSRAQRAYGDSGAPAPLQGEDSHCYEVRLMTQHQLHSKQYSKSNLDSIRDPIVRGMVASSIYADSAAYVAPGELRPRKIRDASGREMTAYDGDDGACWNKFNPPIRYITKFMIPGRA
jgi:hypothetical protein